MPLNYTCAIWRLSKRPKYKSLYWKNLLYATLEKDKPGSGGKEWRSISYSWPIIHDNYDKPELINIEKRASLNDWMFVDTTDVQKPVAHFISSRQIGDTGTLYYFDGVRWNQVMSRIGMVESKDFNTRQPVHLQWVEGRKGDLLVTGFSPTTKKQAEALLYEQHPFHYKYIRGKEVEEGTQYYDTWKVKYGGSITDRDESEAAEMGEKQRLRQACEAKLEEVCQTIRDDDGWHGKALKNKIVKDGLHFFLENAVPSPTVGTTGLQAVAGLFSDLDKSLAISNKFTQSGLESVAGAYMTIHHAYTLYKCLSSEHPDPGKAKQTAADLVSTFFKTSVSVVTTLEVCLKIAEVTSKGVAAAANVAAFVGAAIALFESGRNVRKLYRATKRRVVLKRILRQIKNDKDDKDFNGAELTQLLRFAEQKLERKANRLNGTVLAGTYGAVSGIMIGAAAVGAANFWNPVGWGVGVVALTGGAVITGYVVVRKVTKDTRYKKRLAKGKPANSKDFAQKLIKLYRGKDGNYFMGAEEVLHLFGVKADKGVIGGSGANNSAADKKAVKRIVRHFS